MKHQHQPTQYQIRTNSVCRGTYPSCLIAQRIAILTPDTYQDTHHVICALPKCYLSPHREHRVLTQPILEDSPQNLNKLFAVIFQYGWIFFFPVINAEVNSPVQSSSVAVAQVHKARVSHGLGVRFMARATSTTQLPLSGLWVEALGHRLCTSTAEVRSGLPSC